MAGSVCDVMADRAGSTMSRAVACSHGAVLCVRVCVDDGVVEARLGCGGSGTSQSTTVPTRNPSDAVERLRYPSHPWHEAR
jgi:hypothetical protein